MKSSIIVWLIFTLTSNICYSFDLFDPDRGKAKPQTRRFVKPAIGTRTIPSSIPRSTSRSTSRLPSNQKLQKLIKKLRSSKKLPNPFKQVFPAQSKKISPTVIKSSPRNKKMTGSSSPYYKKSAKAAKKRIKKRKLKRQRDFVLQGTSRIGKRRAVVLKAPNNKQFVQYFEDNVVTEIKGHAGYYLLSVAPREIVIEYPEDAPCRKSNEAKGIICNEEDEGRTALLSLERNHKVKSSSSSAKPKRVTSSSSNSNTTRKKPKNKFKRKVIKPEDVPPGMRVVHTPFGDRLIPAK